MQSKFIYFVILVEPLDFHIILPLNPFISPSLKQDGLQGSINTICLGGVQLYGMIGMHGLLRTDPRDIPDPWYGYQVKPIQPTFDVLDAIFFMIFESQSRLFFRDGQNDFNETKCYLEIEKKSNLFIYIF